MTNIDFVHHPHPHTEQRKLAPPPKVSDQHIGVNGRLGDTLKMIKWQFT